MKYFIYLFIVFVGCNPVSNDSSTKHIKNPINGKWKVISSNIIPFEHISYCKKLELNSIFEFKSDQTLNVYKSLNGEKCTKNQTFKVNNKKLEVLEWDMLFNYEISKLTTDTLILVINDVPSYIWIEAILNDSIIEMKIKEIRETGIVITLEKIHSE